MSLVLRRDVYGLIAPGLQIQDVQAPDPDPLAAVRYSCVYWVDHLSQAVSATRARPDVFGDNGDLYAFLNTKFLYWLEALSLLRAMPEGIVAMRQLERLRAVSVRAFHTSRAVV
jgi:hypothetical protein